MNSNKYFSNNDGGFTTWGLAVDEFGNPVSRGKHDHPYTYSGFVQERVHPNEVADGTVYTDRLLQWDYKLTRKLLTKYFDNGTTDKGGDWWNNRSASRIQEFLRERFDNPKLTVVLVMEYCNVSNGYPLWRIDYATNGVG